MSEIRAGIRDLKSHLSEYLQFVKQGHSVVITSRGKPVGRLIPAEPALGERLKVLQEAGMVAWNGQKLKPITPVAVNQSDRQVSDLVIDMR
jgi:prevent-host-death family protein